MLLSRYTSFYLFPLNRILMLSPPRYHFLVYLNLAYWWFQAPGASEASIRNLPPSAMVDPSNLDAMGLLASNKGKPMEAIVEQVRDGSTLRVYLLPDFQFVQVFVAGIQVDTAEIYVFL